MLPITSATHFNLAVGKGIEPLPFTVALRSKQLCHLDATH